MLFGQIATVHEESYFIDIIGSMTDESLITPILCGGFIIINDLSGYEG